MQYRQLGNTGIKLSALGFGTMRLPVNEDKTINENQAIDILRTGIDGGINYIDTAYLYHEGQSETVVGKALRDGYRDKVYLADKCPVWMIEKEDDFERILEEQLAKLQTNRIDCYLLHALNRERFKQNVKKFHLVEKAVKAKKEGKIGWIGFSFHDSFDVFQEIIDDTDEWDFCQIQYNYINLEEQAGIKGLKLAAERGLGVIVMEPLLGGKLACPAAHVSECFSKEKTPVEHAFDFLWDQPEVSLLLSGMSDQKQVEENLIYADRSFIGMVTEEERQNYKKAKQTFDKMPMVNCTKCRYCMPCPFELDIPEIFAAYNMSASLGREEAKEAYGKLSKGGMDCMACRRCEKECPQHISISEQMKAVSEYFDK